MWVLLKMLGLFVIIYAIVGEIISLLEVPHEE